MILDTAIVATIVDSTAGSTTTSTTHCGCHRCHQHDYRSWHYETTVAYTTATAPITIAIISPITHC